MEKNVPKKRNCIKDKDFDVFSGTTKQITVPIDTRKYRQIIFDKEAFKEKLNDLIDKHIEIFPKAIKSGYILYGILPESKKLPGIRLRRIRLKATKDVFTIIFINDKQ